MDVNGPVEASGTGTGAAAAAVAPVRDQRRVLAASLAGTTIEFYDFYIYATAAALVFGPLFFPTEDAATQLLAAYASLAVAFVARPLGAWAFGHYGDRIGRKSTLVVSLMLMGGSTFAIALLPTYADIGWAAPVLLCLLRFGQGFGLGGEWGGAALLAVENAPPGWRGRYGSVPQLGAPLGFVLANGLFLVLASVMSDATFASWGWRVPFLLSAGLVAVGLWVRLRIAETPAFARVLEEEAPPAVPMGELMRLHWRRVLGGTFGAVACFAVYYIATAFALGYATTTLGIARSTFLSLQVGAILFMGASIALAGFLSDRVGAHRVLAGGSVGAIVAGLVLAPMLGSGSLPAIFACMAFALFVMGFVYGPLAAWLAGLYPARVRYTGVSVAFNLASIIGGGLTPVAAQALATRGGLDWVGAYLAVASALSLVALAMTGVGRGQGEGEPA